MVKPGGTFKPICVISHRFAPLPPSSILFLPSPCSNMYMYLFPLAMTLPYFIFFFFFSYLFFFLWCGGGGRPPPTVGKIARPLSGFSSTLIYASVVFFVASAPASLPE